jgi:hypothetical protein
VFGVPGLPRNAMLKIDRPAARTLLDELRSTAADEGTH